MKNTQINKCFIMNKYFKKSKIILLSAIIFFATSTNIKADGIAGPDRTICKGDTVTIGVFSSLGTGPRIIKATDCYRWQSSGWMETPEKYKTRVAPTETTIYQVTRTSEDFSETEEATVIITVVDKINSITASPKPCCWNKNEKITIDQFNVTTDPPGMGDLCDVSPATVPNAIGLSGKFITEVTISNQCSTTSYAEAKVNIDCAYKDKVSGISPLGLDFGELYKIIKGIPKTVPILPCEPGFSVSGTFNTQNFYLCCPDRTITPCIDGNMIKISGSISGSAGIECKFPWGVPYVAAAYAVVGISGALTLELSTESTCTGSNICVELTPSGTVYGGVELELGPEVLTARGILSGTVTFPLCKYCTDEAQIFMVGDELCLAIEGEVSFIFADFYTYN